jgi:hypothetical protein
LNEEARGSRWIGCAPAMAREQWKWSGGDLV